MYTLAVFAFLAGGLTAQENADTGSTPAGPVKTAAFQSVETMRTGLPPERTTPIRNYEAMTDAPNTVIDLSSHFTDADNPQTLLTYDILQNSFPEVAEITITGHQMQIDYLAPGQTIIIVEASNNGFATTDTFAIGVRPDIETLFGNNIEVATFDNLSLEADSYWNGSDESGSFISGPATFSNSYNPEWFSWYGWAYSSMTDDSTRGYTNQYSAFSPVRIDSADGRNYGVAYASPGADVHLDQHSNQEVKGFFVTNSTWTALSMKYGDAFSKKFGGEDGSDPDWLKLTITGTDTDWNTSTVEYYLADFTHADPAKDHVIETWQWVDLTSLGKVRQLQFTMSSTDNGDWGMNTPAYFCIDNLVVVPDADPFVNHVDDISEEPGKTIVLALNDIFTDPDDPDDSIRVELVPGSWNTAVADPVLGEDSLRIDLLDTGESDLSLAAFSNGKMVTEMFHISVILTSTGRPDIFNSGAEDGTARISAWPNPTSGRFILGTYDVNNTSGQWSGWSGNPSSDQAGNPSDQDGNLYEQTGDQSSDHAGNPSDRYGQLTLIDPSGRVLWSIAEHLTGTPIDISDTPAGVYLLKFETEHQHNVLRIIKK